MFFKDRKKMCEKCLKNYYKELDRLLLAYPHERGTRSADRIQMDMDNLMEQILKLQADYGFSGETFNPEVI